jgi:GT2 family glycosyltransferase
LVRKRRRIATILRRVTSARTEHPSRYVVIPSFDQLEETSRCVAALLQPSREEFTVIVVDHGTEPWQPPADLDASRLVIVNATPDLWWTGATNTGIRHALAAGADTIMLLNSDCVLTGKAATNLMRRSEKTGGIVTPMQTSLDGDRTLCAGALPALALGFPTLRERTTTGGVLSRLTIPCGGRGVAIPASVLEELGLLAEAELPHYWADHDFFLRCRRRGVPLEIAEDLVVKVDEKTTSIAYQPDALDWRSFRASLAEPKSHRNMPAIRAFFRRNYPIRPLHWIGSTLYLLRYIVSWGVGRSARLIGFGRSDP